MFVGIGFATHRNCILKAQTSNSPNAQPRYVNADIENKYTLGQRASVYILTLMYPAHKPLIIKVKWVYLTCSLLMSQNKIPWLILLLLLHF